jgi:CheY-like chemotaxis protein
MCPLLLHVTDAMVEQNPDGCEATRKYREHESLPEGCPIVAVEESNLSSLVDTHSDARTDTYAGISTNAHPSPRCNRLGKKLLIIGMSANSDSETKRLAKEAGMDHFLEKPFVLADFMKLVRES